MIYVYDLLNKKVVSKTQEKHFYAGGEYNDRIKIEFINADDITFAPMMAFKKANNREVSPQPATNYGVGYYEWKLSTMTGLLDVVGDLQFTLFITITNANGSKEVLNAITDVNRIDKAAMIPNSHIFVVGDNPDEIISDVLNAVENLNNTQSVTQNIVSGLVNANLVKSITNNGYVLKVVQHDGTESTIDLSQINANKNAIEGKLNKTDVVDDLNSDSSEKVLSAKQGKKLNNDLININNSLGNRITELTNRINAFYDVDDADLDQLSEIVAYIKSNRELIELLEKQNYIVKTYNEIKLLKDNNKLIPHTKYVVSDYQTTTITEDTRAGETNFVLVITASSSNEFEVNAYAIRKNTTTNKVNLYSIKYCFDNDERFDWVDTINGKGVIFYMEDEYGNKAPYDFKTIQFKRYKITSVDYDYNNEFIGQYVGFVGCQFATIDVNDFRWCYTFQNEDSTEPSDAIDDGFPVVNNQIGIYNSGTNFKNQSLNNIVFYASNDIVEYYGNSYAAREIKDNNIMGESHHITFGGDCTQNILGYCSRYNIIGRVFNHNNIGSDFEYCMIGSYARFNVIGEDFEYCVAGEYMMQNDIGTSCFRNILGDHFRMNKMSSTSAYNVFGSNCKSNVLIANCCNNIIGNNVLGCTFGNDARYSKIGDNICYSSIGSGARYVGLSNSSGDIKCNYHIMDNQQFEENNPKYYEVTENSNVRIELYFDGAWKIKGASTEQAIQELQAQAGNPISQTTTLNQITSQITAQDGTSVIGTIKGNSRVTNNLLGLPNGIKSAKPTSITSVGKNLAKIGKNIVLVSANDVNHSFTDNDLFATANGNSWERIEFKLTGLKPYTTYTMSCDFESNGANGGLRINDAISSISSTNGVRNITFTSTSNEQQFEFYINYGTSVSGAVTWKNIMLVEGNQAQAFEPYQAESLKLKGSVVKRVGKVIYTGTEGWTDWEGAKGVELPSNMRGNSLQAWEDVPQVEMLNNLGVNKISPYRLASGERGISIGNNNWRRLLIDSTTFASISPSNPLVLLYELATPQAQEYDGNSVGVIDLGNLDWELMGGKTNLFQSSVLNGIKIPTSIESLPNVVSNIFTPDTEGSIWVGTKNNSVAVDQQSKIRVYTTAYSSASELKNALKGVMLYYEKSTSTASNLCLELSSVGTISDELVMPNNTLAVVNGGSIIQEGTDTPAQVEITYSLNLVQEVLNNAERDKDQEARIKQLEEQVKSLLQSIQ